jgi:pimeloyl-ACP methyl ester carboxylesterase
MKSMMVTLLALLAVVFAGAAFWLYTPDLPRSTLEARYFDRHSAYVEVEGIRLHVCDSGPKDAPALLLLHGFGASLHTWEPWAQALEPSFRVIRIDLPGSGLTGADPANDYTDARAVRLLVALLDRLGVPRASMIGNSVGGRIAWKLAAMHPERVEKLVLIAPDGFASPGFAYGVSPKVPAVLGLMRVALPRSLLRMNLAPAYADPARLEDATLTRYHDLLRAPGVRTAMLARLEQTVLEPPEPWLRKIAAPTLLLWGEQDAMIPIANAQDYLSAVPNGLLVSLPGLGHVPFEEAPAPALAPVIAFLSR